MFSLRNSKSYLKVIHFIFAVGFFSLPLAFDAFASNAILVCQDVSAGNGYRIEVSNSHLEMQDASGNKTFFYHAEMAPGANTLVFMGMNNRDELELPQTEEEVFTATWTKAGKETKLDCEILQGSLAGE